VAAVRLALEPDIQELTASRGSILGQHQARENDAQMIFEMTLDRIVCYGRASLDSIVRYDREVT
jgi:hypothetical protein